MYTGQVIRTADERELIRRALEGSDDARGELFRLVAAPDVVSVTIAKRGRRIPIPLDNGFGVASAPEGHLDYLVALTDGRTLRVGLPWQTAPEPLRAPLPSGPGLQSPRQVLLTAGTPVEPPKRLFPDVGGDLPIRRSPPDAGSMRLLGDDLGSGHENSYMWTEGGNFCVGGFTVVGSGSACGRPVRVHVFWRTGGFPYADYVIGIAAANVRRCWVQLPDGTRIDATIDRHVVYAAIPLDRALPGSAVHLYAELDDGTVVDERPEILR